MGIPKYLPKEEVDLNSSTLHISSLLSISTLSEKYTLNLDSLTIWPYLSQKVSRTSRMAVQFSWLAFAKNTRSFAKKIWEKNRPLLEAFTGYHNFSLHFSSLSWPKNSMHKMNMFGDNGSPYLIPLDGLIGSSIPLLNKIEVETVETQLIMISTRPTRNLKLRSLSLIKPHSSLS